MRRFISQRRRKDEKQDNTKHTLYGGTGTDGSHYFSDGIYATWVFSYTRAFDYVFNSASSGWSDYSWAKRRSDLWSDIWDYKFDSVLYGRVFWVDASKYQSGWNSDYLCGS